MNTTTRPSGWKNYEDFALGIATNRLPASEALAGRTIELVLPALTITLQLQPAHRLSRIEEGAHGGMDSGWYEAIEVADHTWFIDLMRAGRPEEALTAIVNERTRRVLVVRSRILDAATAGGDPRVAQDFWPGVLAGGGTAEGAVPAETRDLIGLRTVQIYSPMHVYEHTYLNSQRYAWQCLKGVQRGHGATDMASYWKFADNQYLFTFREFLIPVASVFFFNFTSGRSTGKFLGLTGDGAIANNPAGAFMRKTSLTQYPADIAPI